MFYHCKMLQERSTTVTVWWLPGHTGIEGTELSHKAVCKINEADRLRLRDYIDPPAHRCMIDNAEDFGSVIDPALFTHVQCEERKRALAALIPPDPDPLPPGTPTLCKSSYSRHEQGLP